MWRSFKRVREMFRRFMALLLCLVLLLTGCSGSNTPIDLEMNSTSAGNKQPGATSTQPSTQPATQGEVPDLGDDDTTFGEDIEDTGAYDGEFDTEMPANVVVECVSGTKNAYKLEGETLTGKGCHRKMPAVGGGFDVPFWGVFCLPREGKCL